MQCKHIKNQLSAYIDDALTVEEKARVDNHLASCPDCRQALASLQQTIDALRTAPRTPAPDDFLKKVNAKIDARQSLGQSLRETFRRLWTLRIKLPLPMVAATAMAVLVLMIIRSPEIEKVTDTALKNHRQVDALRATGDRPESEEASMPTPEKSKKEQIQDTKSAATKSVPAPTAPETVSRAMTDSDAGVVNHMVDEAREQMARSAAASRDVPRHTMYEQVRPRGERNTPVVITLTLNQQPASPAVKATAPTRLSFGGEDTSAEAVGVTGKAATWKQQKLNNFATEPKVMSPQRSAAALDAPTEEVEEGIMADEEKDIMMLAESALEEEAELEIAEAPPASTIEEVKIQLTELIESSRGKVIIITEATNDQPATMTASIPAETFADFTEQLRQIGQIDVPATIPALERDEARVRVTIRLISP